MDSRSIGYYYTYVHLRNDTGEIFYVGKGRYSKKGKRFSQTKGRNKHWSRVVHKHGFTPMIIASWFDKSSAFDHEREMIRDLRQSGVELVNYTDGGDGTSGWNHSEETKKYIGDCHRSRKLKPEQLELLKQINKGRKPSQKSIDRTRETHTGRKRSDEEIEKSAAKRRGMKRSEESKIRMTNSQKGSSKPKHHVPIRCITTGEEFCSVTIAARILNLWA